MEKGYKNIDEYIEQFTPDVQQILQNIRETIHKEAPAATEKIAYGIPTFYLKSNLVHFAAYKHHIGFYPTSSGIEHFRDKLSGYKLSRGTVQFPIDCEIPYDFIRQIVKFRVKEVLEDNI